MEKNNHFFYVLECKDGSYYAGYTVDLAARVEKHNAGKGAKYTRARKPVKLLYNERFETKSEALKMEYSFKKLSRIEKEKYIRKNRKEGLHNE
ncbi:GIY-YIG nuclease family protein [Metabacillus fastidiosus]|uniref:GIY-YIG nuclease family protein n=1 Tax=Metabacillus fastidiosus TaxID=1458 RepID=A0ABU6P4A5_9BACI|nr:GIY-YIG nuclease family protein [Metabacillus fastidiosus]MED4533464.1 GIY-YIG nuclease family protein [Metabacillus fastidiosus]